MLRSMYSGISGMKNFQVKLDVIGNNIANVNTYGFKKGRTTFKDMVSQQIAGASGTQASGNVQTGGTNPKQVGLGSQLGTIDTVNTQGSLQTTGRTLDLSLSGDGFFTLVKGNSATNDVQDETYTRAGNFYLDVDGNIVNADGLYVAGVKKDGNGNVTGIQAPIEIPSDAKSFSIGSDGTVSYVNADGDLRTAGQVAVAKFPNAEGLQKTGANTFKETANSGVVQFGIAGGTTGAGAIVAGTLEMSNVDLSEEFTEMIVAQRGFQANTRIISTSDQILEELVNLKR